MFDNIGGKIKVLAIVICGVGIVCSIIIGSIITASYDAVDDIALIGFFVMFIGSLLSYIGSFFTYGFGQLIENTDILVGNVEKEKSTKKKEKVKEKEYIKEDFKRDSDKVTKENLNTKPALSVSDEFKDFIKHASTYRLEKMSICLKNELTNEEMTPDELKFLHNELESRK